MLSVIFCALFSKQWFENYVEKQVYDTNWFDFVTETNLVPLKSSLDKGQIRVLNHLEASLTFNSTLAGLRVGLN